MTLEEKYIMIARPKAAYPSWLPVEGPPWRLITQDGEMIRDSDGYTLRFPTDTAALEWMERHSVELMIPEKKY